MRKWNTWVHGDGPIVVDCVTMLHISGTGSRLDRMRMQMHIQDRRSYFDRGMTGPRKIMEYR